MSGNTVQVEVGSKFNSLSLGEFARRSATVWRVVEIADATGGLPHARLVDVADPQSIKMVAVNALRDPNLFRPA